MVQIVEHISIVLSLFSVGIIVYGTIICTYAFVRNEFSSTETGSGIRKLRIEYGGYLLLGLEMLIGADILKSIVEPSYEELIILGGIVFLRTILSVFLNKEIKELE